MGFHLTFEEAVGYLGVYVLLIGLCLCLLVGLYALADLVEQHLRTTKRVIIHTVQATVAMLLLLWVLHGEKLDLATMGPTVLAQLAYYRVVHKSFPFIRVSDPVLIGGALCTVVSHVMWMRYHLNTLHGLLLVLGFFLLVVWLVPFMVLISLAANDNVLPGVASGMPRDMYQQVRGAAGAGGPEGEAGRGRRGTRTLVGSVLEALGRAGKEAFPGGKPKERAV